MEKFSEVTRNYVKELLRTLETTNDENILHEIADDLKSSIKLKILAEELVAYALENKKLVNSFFLLKSISRESNQRLYPDFVSQTASDTSKKEIEKVSRGVTLFKGTLIKMLEKMGLTKSKEQLIKYLVISEGEIDPLWVYKQTEIDEFTPDDFETILKKELEEKYSGKPIIISK
ncbi:MAG: hypothetical protein V1914_01960 [archaeon]